VKYQQKLKRRICSMESAGADIKGLKPLLAELVSLQQLLRRHTDSCQNCAEMVSR
jgi:hypothetical protein